MIFLTVGETFSFSNPEVDYVFKGNKLMQLATMSKYDKGGFSWT